MIPRPLRFLLPGLLGLVAPAAEWNSAISPEPASVLVLANAADADSLATLAAMADADRRSEP